MASLAPNARAYINWGRWIADCPAGCKSALKLEPKQSMFACVDCHAIAPVEWPAEADELWEAVQGRRRENQNWFPDHHELALATGAPHGQSPADLRSETAEHLEA